MSDIVETPVVEEALLADPEVAIPVPGPVEDAVVVEAV